MDVYVGPMNGMVKRLKWFSLSTLAFTAVAVPLFAYKNDDPRWTAGAKAGFLAAVVASSVGSTGAFHLVAGKYVFRVRLLDFAGPNGGMSGGMSGKAAIQRDTLLAIRTMSFWGTERDIVCTVGDVVRVEKGLCTWRVHGRSLFLALPKKIDANTEFSRLMQVVDDC